MATVGNPLAAQPAAPAVGGFDVDGARQAGYSDDDIIGHLSSSRNFDVQGAINSGYSKSDIIQYLSSKPTQPDYAAISRQMEANPPGVPAPVPQLPPPVRSPSFSGQLADAVAGPNTAAGASAGTPPPPAWQNAIPGVSEYKALTSPASSKPIVDLSALPTEKLAPLARAAIPGAQLVPEDAMEGIIQGLAEKGSGLTSEQNLAMLGGMMATGRMSKVPGAVGAAVNSLHALISTSFSAKMIWDAYQEYPGFKQALNRGDTKEAARLLTSMVAGTAMAAGGLKGAYEGGQAARAAMKPAEAPPPTGATLPSSPPPPQETAAQIQEVVAGRRPGVMFVKGVGQPVDTPNQNIGIARDESHNTYWYRTDMPTMISKKIIEKAVTEGRIHEVLAGVPPEPPPVAAEQPKEEQKPESTDSGERFRGLWNVPLDEAGRQKLQQTAQLLAGKVTRIVTAALGRHEETARAIAATNPQATVEVTPKLNPLPMTDVEGQPVTPESLAIVNDRITNHFDDPFPGRGQYSGATGISPHQWYADVINTLSREISRWHREGGRILLITSGRDIQAIRAWEAGGFGQMPDFKVLTGKWQTDPGEILHYDPKSNTLRDVKDINEDGIFILRHERTAANAGAAEEVPKPAGSAAQVAAPAPPRPVFRLVFSGKTDGEPMPVPASGGKTITPVTYTYDVVDGNGNKAGTITLHQRWGPHMGAAIAFTSDKSYPGARDLPSTLAGPKLDVGSTAIREVIRQVKALHPEIKEFRMVRITGAPNRKRLDSFRNTSPAGIGTPEPIHVSPGVQSYKSGGETVFQDKYGNVGTNPHDFDEGVPDRRIEGASDDDLLRLAEAAFESGEGFTVDEALEELSHRYPNAKIPVGTNIQGAVFFTHLRNVVNRERGTIDVGIGTPEPIRTAAATPPPVPPPPIGEPEMISGNPPPVTPPPVPAGPRLGTEAGVGNILLAPAQAFDEPIELYGKRAQMQRALTVRKPSQQQAQLGQYSREYYVGNRDWWITVMNQALDVMRTLPDTERRALSIMREFRRRRGELVQILADNHPTYKKDSMDPIKPEIRLALNPTKEMVDADKKLTQIATLHLVTGQKLGFMKESKIKPDEYVPHDIIPQYYINEPDQIGPATGGNQRRNFTHAKAREVWPTFVDAINEGALPKTMDAVDAFTVYAKEFASTRATVLWENWLKKLGLGEWSAGKPERIGPTSAATELVPYARSSHRFEYEFPYEDPQTKKLSVSHLRFWTPKYIDKAMEPVTKADTTQDWQRFKSFQEYQQYVKGIDLLFSFFHPKALFMMLISNVRKLGDFTAWKKLDLDSKWSKDTEADGALFGMPTDVAARNWDALQRMENGKMPTWGDIIKKAPVAKLFNEIAEHNTKLIFGVMQRKMKIWTYGTMRDLWLKEHPNATPEEVVEMKTSLARFTNAKFGGMNWEMMGWTKTELTVARFFIFAPDWFMSNIESARMALEGGIGKTIKGSARQVPVIGKRVTPGAWESSAGSQNARRFWIQGMLAAGFATQMTSILLTGHRSKYWTQVDLGNGKYLNMYFTGAPGELVNVINAIDRNGLIGGMERWSLGKGNLAARAYLQGSTGETYAGKKINDPDLDWKAKTIRTTAYEARTVSPVPFSFQNIIDSWTMGNRNKDLAKDIATIIVGGRPAYPEKEKKPTTRPDATLMEQIMTGKSTVSNRPPEAVEHTKILRDIREGKATAEEMARAGQVATRKQIATAQRQGKLTPLQRQVKGASAQAAVIIYDKATPEQRREIAPLVRAKAQRARAEGWDWTDYGAELAKKYFGVDVQRVGTPGAIKAR